MSQAFDDHVAAMSEEQVRKFYSRMMLDSVEDEKMIDELAAQALPRAWLDGTSYGVPGPVQIVEELVEEIKALRKNQSG